MDADADVPSVKKTRPATPGDLGIKKSPSPVSDVVASASAAAAAAAAATTTTDTAASSASRNPPPPSAAPSVEVSITASSGLTPPPESPESKSSAPTATAASAPASAGRRSPSASSAGARHPLPSRPSEGLSSSSGVASAQPTPPARDSTRRSASASTSRQDKMAKSEKEGKEETPAKSPANQSPPAQESPANALEDEIVVGTKTNGSHSSPQPAVSEPEDAEMEDVKPSPEPPYPKRKRSSLYNKLDEEKIERSFMNDDADTTSSRGPGRPPKYSNPPPAPPIQRSIILGYWRDSSVPDEKEKHAVIGFIDSRDRLRTRIQQNSRTGNHVASDYPLPPGPGGSWVTFERVVFEKHLVGLDHNQVKEYVKILSEDSTASETPEQAREAEKAAVTEAIRRAALHPTPDNIPPPAIAYGVDLPDYVVNATRPEKRRRMASTGSNYNIAPSPAGDRSVSLTGSQLPHAHLAPAGSPSVVSAIQRSALDLLPGTRPTKILLGYWRGSSEERLEDKHAVYGILGANDMFRVKVTRETRDGRPVLGNFPTGAGALWIHYDEVEFEKHIRHLSRPEVKEFVRVRQRQLDEGEIPEQRIENETKAVYEAQARVISAGGAAQSTLGTAGRVDTISFASAANLSREMNRHVDSAGNELPGHGYPQDGRSRREYPGHELRQTRRSFGYDAHDNSASSIAAAAVAATPSMPRPGRHSLPDGMGMPADMRGISRAPTNGMGESHPPSGPNGHNNRVERTNSLARREIARVETIQMRNEQRAASREAAMMANGTAGGANGPSNPANLVLPSQLTNGLAANGGGSNSAAGGGAGANGSNGSNGTSSRQAFSENIGRLNKVWASQEATRLRAGGEDAKIYMGVKYERKQTGPFQGKLVSPGTILSIDGEDYVEYRVLTKPTFF